MGYLLLSSGLDKHFKKRGNGWGDNVTINLFAIRFVQCRMVEQFRLCKPMMCDAPNK